MNRAYWIGLNDYAVEGSFVWTDGSAPAYTDWNDREPSNGPNEDCVRLWREDWMDTACYRQIPYICELNIST